MSKRLFRSSTDRILAGVAGGMAAYFDVDVSIVRLVWLLLVLAGGSGLLLYVIAAIIIPTESSGRASPAAEPRPRPARRPDSRGSASTMAVLLIGAGLFLLLKDHVPFRLMTGWMLPVLLILGGVWLLVDRRDGGR